MNMSAAIPAPAATTAKRKPLAVGEAVQVIAGTYSAVKVGTVARIARVRPRCGRDQPELYELEAPDLEGGPWLFWARELTRSE